MIKLLDLITEGMGRYNVGPFYHETDSKNVDDILENGIYVGSHGYISLVPGDNFQVSYGDAMFEVWITDSTFIHAFFSGWANIGHEIIRHGGYNKKKIQEFADMVDMIRWDQNRNPSSKQLKIIKKWVFDEDVMSGELAVSDELMPHQIKLIKINS